jgi:hypothetical protein
MEEFALKIDTARKKIYVAEYMLGNTYAMLKEPKLLLSILENINLAYMSAVESILYYERSLKKIPPFSKNPDIIIDIYTDKVQKKYKLDAKYLKVLVEIKNLVDARQNASTEFQRKENYIIADDFENLKKVTPADIKKYIDTCKAFVHEIENAIKPVSEKQ